MILADILRCFRSTIIWTGLDMASSVYLWRRTTGLRAWPQKFPIHKINKPAQKHHQSNKLHWFGLQLTCNFWQQGKVWTGTEEMRVNLRRCPFRPEKLGLKVASVPPNYFPFLQLLNLLKLTFSSSSYISYELSEGTFWLQNPSNNQPLWGKTKRKWNFIFTSHQSENLLTSLEQ